jgi:hypothetical protein
MNEQFRVKTSEFVFQEVKFESIQPIFVHDDHLGDHPFMHLIHQLLEFFSLEADSTTSWMIS